MSKAVMTAAASPPSLSLGKCLVSVKTFNKEFGLDLCDMGGCGSGGRVGIEPQNSSRWLFLQCVSECEWLRIQIQCGALDRKHCVAPDV